MKRAEDGRMPESYEALLTAGMILAGLGVYFLTIPAGVVFGGVLLVAGIVMCAIVLRRAIPEWRAAQKERAASGRDATQGWRAARDDLAASRREWYPDDFWNPERLLKNGVAVGGVWLGAGLVQSIWSAEPAWYLIGFGAGWLLSTGVALGLLVWRRRRAS